VVPGNCGTQRQSNDLGDAVAHGRKSWKPKPTVLNYTCFRSPFTTFPIRTRKNQVRMFPYQSFDYGFFARDLKTETP
jgi:hypothetical protein